MAPKLTTPAFGTLPVTAKVFILFAGLALLSAGYYVGLHMGLEDELQSERQRQTTLETQLREANERQKEFLRLREEVATREPLDRQNLRILPLKAEIPAFLDDLNRLAELSGLSMGSVRPHPERGEEFYVSVPVELSIEGRYHQLAKFFYNISRLERAINMQNIQVSQPKVVGDEVLLGVRVLATTFRRKDEDV
jgi:type IV pilus assembly protein PilO